MNPASSSDGDTGAGRLPASTRAALAALLGTLEYLDEEATATILEIIQGMGAGAPIVCTDDEPLLTMSEAAELLGVDRTTLWRWFVKQPSLRQRLGVVEDHPGTPRFHKTAIVIFKREASLRVRGQSNRKRRAN